MAMTVTTVPTASRVAPSDVGNPARIDTFTGADVVRIEYDALGSLELSLVDVVVAPAGHDGHGARVRRLVFASVWGLDCAIDASLGLAIVCEIETLEVSPLLERYRDWCADVGTVERTARRHYRVTFDHGVLDILATGHGVVLQTEMWGTP